ncbi:hypothetical protein FD755_012379 [Muntiacus reevesi]|uniref:Anterior gradient protein 2 homolog n=1 Tax=Muntiacus reevesi TaxID=9886 RepID=A0A5N3XPC2_MUNRE|nr:hypothetical protein FD755_012379 [Muntiacus reevesi]
MEKIPVSTFLLLVALSYTLAKDTTVKPGAKKDTKDPQLKLPQTLSRGWGDQLIWTQTYEEALYKSKTSNKPLMVIHHLDECPHSQALKKAFAENKEIQKLAEQFVLLNLVLFFFTSFHMLLFLHLPLNISDFPISTRPTSLFIFYILYGQFHPDLLTANSPPPLKQLSSIISHYSLGISLHVCSISLHPLQKTLWNLQTGLNVLLWALNVPAYPSS